MPVKQKCRFPVQATGPVAGPQGFGAHAAAAAATCADSRLPTSRQTCVSWLRQPPPPRPAGLQAGDWRYSAAGSGAAGGLALGPGRPWESAGAAEPAGSGQGNMRRPS